MDRARRAGLGQLARLELGEQIEESHMRNRQLVAGWAYAQGEADKVIEKKVKDGKTYFDINDYDKLRGLFGELLREIQRIKSVMKGEEIVDVKIEYPTDFTAQMLEYGDKYGFI